LELRDCVDLLRERVDDRRVERILPFETIDKARVGGFLWELAVPIAVELEVRFRDGLSLIVINLLEEPVLEDLSDLVSEVGVTVLCCLRPIWLSSSTSVRISSASSSKAVSAIL